MPKYDVTFTYNIEEFHTVYAIEADDPDEAEGIAFNIAREDLDGVPYENLNVEATRESVV